MSRPAKPARLWDRKDRDEWYINYLDENGKRRQEPTGCRLADRRGAEKALEKFLASHTRPSRDSGRDPSAIAIAELLNLYCQDRGPKIARPEALGQRIKKLLAFFGDKPVTAINKRLCRDYAEQRSTPQAARRELEDLRAALGHAFDEEILAGDIRRRVELPPKAPARERWLTVEEAARLVRAAWRFRSREEISRPTRQHVARFILVGLYTGTRSAAICGAALDSAIGRGYVDLDQGVFYRRAPGTIDSNKKQTPVRLPLKLLNHIRRWKRRGISLKAVVEFNGEPIRKINKGFAQCVADAGLEGKVSPHTLRHTAITWALQAGKRPYDVADFFGVSEHVITTVYGHHCPDRHVDVGQALERRKPNGR